MGKEIGEAEKTDCDAGVILWREIKKEVYM